MVSAVGHLSPRRFSISWRELDCRDINDDLASPLQYVVQYRLSGSTQTVSQLVVSTTMTTATNPSLGSFVDYEFEVAAVNGQGMGKYSSPVKGVILEGGLVDCRPP